MGADGTPLDGLTRLADHIVLNQIMDTDYDLDCLPGSMERQPRSTLHQDENHALSIPPNTICLFLSRPAKQRIQPQIPFS